MPAPPPTVESPPLGIEDAKTMDDRPVDDPLGDAFENFHGITGEEVVTSSSVGSDGSPVDLGSGRGGQCLQEHRRCNSTCSPHTP
jgi:hypothetical protein